MKISPLLVLRRDGFFEEHAGFSEDFYLNPQYDMVWNRIETKARADPKPWGWPNTTNIYMQGSQRQTDIEPPFISGSLDQRVYSNDGYSKHQFYL